MRQDHLPGSAVTEALAAAGVAFDARAAQIAAAASGPRRRQAQSETTRTAYMRDLGLYLDLCEQHGRTPGTSTALDAFAAMLMQRPVEKGKNKGRTGWAPASIRKAISAVRTYHDLMGDNLPSLSLAGQRLAEYVAGRAADPTTTDDQGAPGLRLPTLADMFAALPADTNAGLRDRAMLSLGWAMMAPRLVLADLDIGHLTRTGSGLDVTVYRNLVTGRPLDQPRTVTVPAMPHLGELCPSTNALAWKTRLASLHVTSGPFLRSVDRYDTPAGIEGHAGPSSPGHRMDPGTVDRVVARAAARAGIPGGDNLVAQSLRRGGVEDAFAAGADTIDITRHAGYGDRSAMVFKLIGDMVREQRNALDGIVLPDTSPPD